MNVSAANPELTQDDQTAKVPVYLVGYASKAEYVIEVSPSITINLDDNTTLASNLAESSPQDVNGGIYLKLKKAVNFEDKNLQVTPSFAVLDKDPSVTLAADDNQTDNSYTLSSLGVDSTLLKFGTYTDDSLTKGSDSIAFTESENKDDVKSVPTYVDSTKSAGIRRAMPAYIDGHGNVHIADKQQIGNVTFTCAFVKAEAESV